MGIDKFSSYVIGGDSLLVQCAEVLLEAGHDLKAVITATPRVSRWARERGVAVIDADSDFAAVLGREPFDYLFVITHLTSLPAEIVGLARRGTVKFHDGPLPGYAGLYTPAWAVIHRQPRHGITWHLLEPGLHDREGDVLKERAFELSPSDTALTVNTKCFEAGIESFGELVGELASGSAQRHALDGAQRRHYGSCDRPEAACTLQWTHSAVDIDALVRALDFGQYENPIGLAKLAHGGRAFAIARCTIEEEPTTAPPGTLLGFEDDHLRIATGEGAVALSGFSTLSGEAISVKRLVDELALVPGAALDALENGLAQRLTRLQRELAAVEPDWQRRLEQLDPLQIPYANAGAGDGPSRRASFEIAVPDASRTVLGRMAPADAATVALASFLSRLGGKQRFDVAFADGRLREAVAGLTAWVAPAVPMCVDAPADADLRRVGDRLGDELATLRRLRSYANDAVVRKPELRLRPELRAGGALPVAIVQGTPEQAAEAAPGASVRFVISDDGRRCTCSYDLRALGMREAAALSGQMAAFFADLAQRPDARLAELSLLTAEDRRRILHDWNQTALDHRRDVCVHELVQEQVERTPDAIAVAFEQHALDYRELNARANRLAHYLRELGVGPDRLVGVCIERSLELVVAILAVHKAGGAYVPLDPAYPRERLSFMIEDSAVSVLLTHSEQLAELPSHAARVVCVDADPRIAQQPDGNPASGVRPEHLAYVIYTSGSTGKPKGVMVEHRNVVNFFAGMDPVIAHEPPGTWCAVTSLSFDISVLELLWTLARGFTVLVHRDRERGALPAAGGRTPARKLDFSVFMWGADDQASAGKYELMLRAARFADERGFAAIWTPERHFHAFGGPYPNPAVTGAAIAAITSRLQVRAGSCVVPLHHPARVAEEWAVVDNLSNGRVGISFASGWQPDDFLLRPENFKDSKRVMAESIEQVRKLWRGEKLSFMGPLGKPVEVLTQPRPVQKELPYWVTTAGSPETYRLAGAMGANVLTHLLGQTVEEVGEKIRVYRSARKEAGLDPDAGVVSLMLHTFVGEDTDEVRALVRDPMKSYLRSSVTLIKNFAWAFPAFKRPKGQEAKPEDIDLTALSAEELDAILEFAFERYFETSGLFGTVETCLRMIERVRAAGVDDIACLIDFGVPSDKVADALAHLDTVRRRANEAVVHDGLVRGGEDLSLPGQLARHGVTHMQCTPSMARMLLSSDEGRAALRSLQHLMIGGEALPGALARELLELSGPTLTNMYGPTETTIWSSTHRVQDAAEPIPIGRPIANTRMYVLDASLAPVPLGVPGELYIGGEGVVRGYLNRPELTAERFVRDPHDGRPDALMYRTGDLARFRDDGALEFLGRGDHQVKIRGYRIELGEIESALNDQQSVREAVVVAREDTPGDQRLVAYLVPDGKTPSGDELREALRARLPEYMVPSRFVSLERLPLTPNGKIDRRALPAPDAVAATERAEYVAPQSELEQAIAAAWCETLGLDKVGVRDNFFDLGGHSLLVVRLHRRLQGVAPRPLSLTDLYRFPTVLALAAHLTAEPSEPRLEQSQERAKLRFEMRRRRARDARQ